IGCGGVISVRNWFYLVAHGVSLKIVFLLQSYDGQRGRNRQQVFGSDGSRVTGRESWVASREMVAGNTNA
ncbi:MAG TPA: hypothetical protein VF493_09645, partial [Terriglobales bacterium]